MRVSLLLTLAGIIFLAGCGCTAAQLAVTPLLVPGAENVRVGRDDPDSSMVEIGPIIAKHGSGCGYAGSRGTYEGAYNILKNLAVEMGAEFVRIMMVQIEPHSREGCFDNHYVIRGIAYQARPLILVD